MNEMTTKTPLKTMPIRQIPNVQALLINDNARAQLAVVAAKHLNPERMMRVVANAIRTTPALQDCDPLSFLGALMQCASLGLEPNTILGHAYLIPFKNSKKGITEVQLVVGYKGLIDLARRSGHITAISANVHYSDDDLWEYEEGTEAQLRHRPGPLEGKPLHAYAIAKFRDGGHAYVVMPWSQVLKIRDESQGWKTAVRFNATDKSPWKTHVDAMAKKTAIRALAKYLPLSVEFSDAMSVDEKPMDYRALAIDATLGAAPASDDQIEGEAVDQETGEVAADDSKADERAEAQAKADSLAAAEKAEAERLKQEKADMLRKAKADERAEAEAAAKAKQTEAAVEPDWSQNGWAKGFIKDVQDMGFDAAMDLHSQDLERMKDEKPGLHSYCMTEGTRIGG